jgi:hypothetical protein
MKKNSEEQGREGEIGSSINEKSISANETLLGSVSKPKKNKIPLYVAIGAVVVIGAVTLYSTRTVIARTVTPKIYVAKTLNNTGKMLDKEMSEFLNSNVVLNTQSQILKNSYEEKLSMDTESIMDFIGGPLDISTINDVNAKKIKMEIDMPSISKIALYLSDYDGIVSIFEKNISFSPTDITNDFQNFYDNNIDFLEEIGLTYGEQTEFDIPSLAYSDVIDVYKNNKNAIGDYLKSEDGKGYTAIFTDFISNSKISISPNTNLTIGDKLVKGSTTEIKFDAKAVKKLILDWAKYIESDEGMSAYAASLDIPLDEETLSEALSEFMEENSMDVTVKLIEYKDSYVSANLIFGDLLEIEIGAIGGDYRLNNVFVNINSLEQEESIGIRAEGKHIGKVLSSKITIKNPDEDLSFNIDWDTEKKDENFSINVPGLIQIVSTFAVNDDAVIFKLDNIPGLEVYEEFYKSVFYSLKKFEGEIDFPTDTEPLNEIDAMDIYESRPFPLNLFF